MIETLLSEKAPFNATRLFMVLLCGLTALQMMLRFRDQWRFSISRPAQLYGPPPRLLGLWQMPSLSSSQFLLAGGGFILALILSASGIYPRFSLVVALSCHLLYFSQIMGLSYIQRKPSLIAVCLAILAVSPGLDQPLGSPSPSWPITLVQVALAQMYFSAGFQKLRRSGRAWIDGESLRAYLAEHHLWAGTQAAWWLASRPTLCRAASVGVLLWELTFPIVLLYPGLVPIYAWSGVAFHIGGLVALRIDYLTYLAPVYSVFLIRWVHRLLATHGWWPGLTT